MAVWNGFIYGLLLSVLIGPVFFALIQNSIEKGFKAGAFMAIGIALSDSIYILITYFGISKLTENETFNMWLGGVGGAIMLGFGLVYIFKPVPAKGTKQAHDESGLWFQQILKGFFLNGINPFVLFFWVGIMTKISISYQYSPNQTLIFFVVLIATVISTDLLKSYFAMKLSEIITPRFMKIMNRVVGLALIVFSVKLFTFVLEGFGYSIPFL